MAALITATGLRIITVTNVTLFDVAAQYLGDPLQWSRIARLNGLDDPWVTGSVELTLPAVEKGRTDDGVLRP